MARIALAAGALAVVALVAALMIQARPESGGAEVAAPAPSREVSGDALTAPGAPRRMESPAPAAVDDASPLPSPEDVQAARARVEAAHDRNPNRAPHILDNNLKAKPMRAARKAFARGDYPLALERAEDALAVEPEASSARVLAVLAACGLGESAIAQAHAEKLDDMRKSRVARRCSKLGVELRGMPDVPDDL